MPNPSPASTSPPPILSLLPRIIPLLILPSESPSLITHVLPALRTATISNPTLFPTLTPILLHLFSTLLKPTLHLLHPHACKTCIVFLYCLIVRKEEDVVEVFIEDVGDGLRRLVEGEGGGLLLKRLGVGVGDVAGVVVVEREERVWGVYGILGFLKVLMGGGWCGEVGVEVWGKVGARLWEKVVEVGVDVVEIGFWGKEGWEFLKVVVGEGWGGPRVRVRVEVLVEGWIERLVEEDRVEGVKRRRVRERRGAGWEDRVEGILGLLRVLDGDDFDNVDWKEDIWARLEIERVLRSGENDEEETNDFEESVECRRKLLGVMTQKSRLQLACTVLSDLVTPCSLPSLLLYLNCIAVIIEDAQKAGGRSKMSGGDVQSSTEIVGLLSYVISANFMLNAPASRLRRRVIVLATTLLHQCAPLHIPGLPAAAESCIASICSTNQEIEGCSTSLVCAAGYVIGCSSRVEGGERGERVILMILGSELEGKEDAICAIVKTVKSLTGKTARKLYERRIALGYLLRISTLPLTNQIIEEICATLKGDGLKHFGQTLKVEESIRKSTRKDNRWTLLVSQINSIATELIKESFVGEFFAHVKVPTTYNHKSGRRRRTASTKDDEAKTFVPFLGFFAKVDSCAFQDTGLLATAALLVVYAKGRTAPRTSGHINDSDAHAALVAASTALGMELQKFVSSRLQDLLVLLHRGILGNDSLFGALRVLLGFPEAKVLWIRVAKSALPHIIEKRDTKTLELLAKKVGKPTNILVEGVCVDILVQVALKDAKKLYSKHQGLGFLSGCLSENPKALVESRMGKITQKLATEFGGKLESNAKTALDTLAQKMDGRVEGRSLVQEHFMLVMEAVNRGLFPSWITSSARATMFTTLDHILRYMGRRLKQFVPKVMASLKLALSLTVDNGEDTLTVLRVWSTFLLSLESDIGQHLNSAVAVLVPFLDRYSHFIASVVLKIVKKYGSLLGRNHLEKLAFLIETVAHPSFSEVTRAIAQLESSDVLDDGSHAASGGSGKSSSNTDALPCSINEELLSMASDHESAKIRESALDRILQFLSEQRTGELREVQELVLRGHRGMDNPTDSKEEVHFDDTATDKAYLNVLSRLVGKLIDSLTDSSPCCREKAAKCLGQIGAIDPRRLMLQPNVQPNQSLPTLGASIGNHWVPSDKSGWKPRVLASEILVGYLVPALRQGDHSTTSHRQNRVGFVIQELLKLCGCTATTPGLASSRATLQGSATTSFNDMSTPEDARPGMRKDKVPSGDVAVQFWSRLCPEIQSTISPYLSAPYTLAKTSVLSETDFSSIDPGSIWKSSNGVKEWVKTLACRIATFVEESGFLGNLLASLRPLLKYEHHLAVSVLPLLIREAVDWGVRKKGQPTITQRLLSTQGFGHENSNPGQIAISQDSSDIIAVIIGEVSTAIQESNDAAHLLFFVLDKLTLWRSQRVNSRLIGSRRKHHEALAAARRRAQTKLITHLTRSRPSFPLYLARDSLTPLVDLNGNGSFPLILLATTALESRTYQRALLYLEQHTRLHRLTNVNKQWASNLGLLLDKSDEADELRMFQRIYAELEDADSLAGVAAIRGETSLSEMIIDAEACGKYDDALICYERALGSNPRDANLHAGFLKCLRTLGYWETMLNHANALVTSASSSEKKLRGIAGALGIEAAWRLGRWDRLEELTLNDELVTNSLTWEPKYGYAVGKMLLSLKRTNSVSLNEASRKARLAVLDAVPAIATEGYSRIYPFIARLHTIADIEDCARRGNQAPLLISMKHRAELVAPTLRVREPIMSTRSVCFEVVGQKANSVDVNLELSRYSRESGNLRAAASSAYRARSSLSNDAKNTPDVALEIAKITYKRGDTTNALLTVSKEIERLENAMVISKDSGRSRLAAAHLLAGQWKEESRSAPSSAILSHYQRAAVLDETAENTFYALGRHYDMLLRASSSTTDGVDSTILPHSAQAPSPSKGTATSHLDYTPLIIKNFSAALKLGHSRIFEALPRMLTVWLDFHTYMEEHGSTKTTSKTKKRVLNETDTSFSSIPNYMWMTVMPQMLSRLLHPSKAVKHWLTKLIAICVACFPDQCVWLVAPSVRVRSSGRKKAVNEILKKAYTYFEASEKRTLADAKVLNENNKDTIETGLAIIKELISIASNIVKNSNCGIRAAGSEFNRLRRLLPAPIIIPTLQALTVVLPRGHMRVKGTTSTQNHYPFGEDAICMQELEDKVMVMSSAMRPRRIGFLGTDGQKYRFLAKKEDQGDMRKDSRLIEFISVVNRLLAKDRECQVRHLNLKTYAVLPLTEQTGIIEWVNDLKTMREVVRVEHSQIGITVPSPDISDEYDKYKNKVEWFTKWAVPNFPAVLHRFFLTRFGSDPLRWYNAKLRWTRSVALWSMTGYVVGLGDRHCENVMIETTHGSCVHVDFAMIFEKGKSLRVPEIVPFRLTQNMVDAMGVQGYEGCFRVVSELTMSVLRKNSDALMGVLESFLHDPMADWKKIASQRHKSATTYAQETRTAVEQKLSGVVDTGLPLSIQGQVERLIHEATSSRNLGEMYIWWSPWI